MRRLCFAFFLALFCGPAMGSDLGDSSSRDSAPDTFKVRFTTTAGSFVVKVDSALAPSGAQRMYDLVQRGFYDDVAVFRVIEGFVAQFGIHGQPEVAAAWRNERIPDDPVMGSNKKKTVTFAMAGPNTRTTQVFINLTGNTPLDRMGFAPIGRVTRGWKTVTNLYSGYGEGAPRGSGPNQARVQDEGNAYLKANFPRLDYILEARVL